MNHPTESFQVEPYSIIRFLYLAVDDAQPNELWFIGTTMELQKELSLDDYTEVCFELGDEINFRQSVLKVVAIEINPLPPCPQMPAAEKVMTYYIASSDFPLM
ncbi:hypothetical protein SAMN05421781_0354 [Marinococcus luteus]|uniref:Uncharacterized protein n=1 Tax=Marinococcus luteus TaxID=1122204 RepID=A0A1H2QLD0_9BACI|nr:hypothetical protein [Marinococcus luteus]SDW07464.1 hypothetical protein SAMN05421781_0354 [Marinococcus luteus]